MLILSHLSLVIRCSVAPLVSFFVKWLRVHSPPIGLSDLIRNRCPDTDSSCVTATILPNLNFNLVFSINC